MKSVAVVLFMIMSSMKAFAGGDVPWPIQDQEAVRVSDLTGTWVSLNVKNPGLLYFFSFEAVDLPYVANGTCPYRLVVEQMDEFDHVMVSKGTSVACSVHQASMLFRLYDADGQLKNILHIVGLRKELGEEGMGNQYLGVRIYDGSERPQLIAADAFFKFSDKPMPMWPPTLSQN